MRRGIAPAWQDAQRDEKTGTKKPGRRRAPRPELCNSRYSPKCLGGETPGGNVGDDLMDQHDRRRLVRRHQLARRRRSWAGRRRGHEPVERRNHHGFHGGNVQAVSFDDPAATFIETATGTLVASGNVTIDAASMAIDGQLEAGGIVALSASNAITSLATIEQTQTLVADTLSGTLLIGTISAPSNTIAAIGTTEPAGLVVIDGQPIIKPTPAPIFHLASAVAIDEPWFTDAVTYQPAAVFIAAPIADISPPELSLSAVNASAGLGPFASANTALSLRGPSGGAVPTWGLAMPPRTFSGGVTTITGAGTGPSSARPGSGRSARRRGRQRDPDRRRGQRHVGRGKRHDRNDRRRGQRDLPVRERRRGGTVTIENFAPGQDFVALRGYGSAAGANALATDVVAGGSSTVTLPDNSRITFANVGNLTASDFR